MKGVRFNKSSDGLLTLELTGEWQLGVGAPSESEVRSMVEENLPVRGIAFESSGLAGWDSAILIVLRGLLGYCSMREIEVDDRGLPEGVRRLLKLALAVPEKKDVRRLAREPVLSAIGSKMLHAIASDRELLDFIGETFLSAIRFIRGKTVYRRVDLIGLIYECGAHALPIVSLISILVGLILAFVGAIQLKMFGAQIYIANLVGIAMAREMGAMMTGIIMAGRTGAAFAAQIGTMQVNEEIDALTTLGISPIEFLVMPRMLAMLLMMPLLCVYADLLGILGGFVVGVGMLDLSFMEYFNQTRYALGMTNFWIGIAKSLVFGVLVALSGCFRGMHCGRSASAVGEAATSAVVTAIVWIIVSDAVFAVLTQILNI